MPARLMRNRLSADREFRDKWQSRIDAVGPCCSCLVIMIIIFVGAMFLLDRCR